MDPGFLSLCMSAFAENSFIHHCQDHYFQQEMPPDVDLNLWEDQLSLFGPMQISANPSGLPGPKRMPTPSSQKGHRARMAVLDKNATHCQLLFTLF